MGSRADVMAGLRRAVEEAVVGVAVNVQAELVEATPVDTGFAAANWQLSIGEPADGTVDLSGSVADLVGYTIDQGPVYSTNNATYIQRLNAGSSTQAPAGFVEVAIAQGVARS